MGCFEISGIPPCRRGTPVTVEVSILDPGVVEVKATVGDGTSGRSKSLNVNQNRRLGDAEIKRLRMLTKDRLNGKRDGGSNSWEALSRSNSWEALSRRGRFQTAAPKKGGVGASPAISPKTRTWPTPRF
ncbi:uncharacterized protein B0I36DRAFT_397131 [Microdochium trichocladiopsis]|uniref:Uncharacterized protein n=1 Tax=Microdochium trichocladiopsis TaxID=1682393 RepID=A0A9P8XTK9_9PEZI|nr:uncharacterized protein B0I36DRAFT_397131 [Microdochium trichocladiopsis]KAH7016515.1 hypothetical protein B0I36DRAFT_397131 [Microdochium trichocladiopsis]